MIAIEHLKKAVVHASIEFNRAITIDELRRPEKYQAIVQPRWFVMAYLYATGRYSFPQIAHGLRRKDHTTVLHGLRRAHGHDGKTDKEPLWTKEQFKHMVLSDGFSIVCSSLDELEEIGAAQFKNGSGWELAS